MSRKPIDVTNLPKERAEKLLEQREYSKIYYAIHKDDKEWKARKNTLAKLNYQKRKLLKLKNASLTDLNTIESKEIINDIKDNNNTEAKFILTDVNMTYLGAYDSYDRALEDAKYYAKRGDYSDVLYILKRVTKVELNTIIRELGD